MTVKYSTILNVVLKIVSILLILGTLTIGFVTTTYTTNFYLASSYTKSLCSLTGSSTVLIECTSDYYVPVWRNANGRTVLESPFSASKHKVYVDSQLNNYPLDIPIECLCRKDTTINYPSVQKELGCDVYGQCFLNVQLLDFIRNQQYLNGIGIALIVMGMVRLVIFIILFVIKCFTLKKNQYQEIDSEF